MGAQVLVGQVSSHAHTPPPARSCLFVQAPAGGKVRLSPFFQRVIFIFAEKRSGPGLWVQGSSPHLASGPPAGGRRHPLSQPEISWELFLL